MKAPTVVVPSDTKIAWVIRNWGADEVTVTRDGNDWMAITYHRYDYRCGGILKSICNFLQKHFSDDWDITVVQSPKLYEVCDARVRRPGDERFNNVPTLVTKELLGI